MVWFMARRALVAVLVLFFALAIVFFPLGLAGEGHGEVWQFPGWIGGALAGNLGLSSSQQAPVSDIVVGRLALTGPLLLLGLAIGGLLGTGWGVLAARQTGAWGKALMRLASAIGGIPAFWLSLVFSLVFAGGLHWFAAGGFVPWGRSVAGALWSLLLPALALGLSSAGPVAIAVRNALVHARAGSVGLAGPARSLTASEAYRRTGRRRILLDVIAPGGAFIAAMIINTVVVETVFYLPGLGRLLIDAALTRDVVLLRGGLLVVLTTGVVPIVAAQIAAGWLDPRIRRRATA